jgi:hypothetical protein
MGTFFSPENHLIFCRMNQLPMDRDLLLRGTSA